MKEYKIGDILAYDGAINHTIFKIEKIEDENIWGIDAYPHSGNIEEASSSIIQSSPHIRKATKKERQWYKTKIEPKINAKLI